MTANEIATTTTSAAALLNELPDLTAYDDGVQVIKAEIKLFAGLFRSALLHAIRAGELLAKKKQKIEEDGLVKFDAWVQRAVGITGRHANNLIRVFQHQDVVLAALKDDPHPTLSKALDAIKGPPKSRTARTPTPVENSTQTANQVPGEGKDDQMNRDQLVKLLADLDLAMVAGKMKDFNIQGEPASLVALVLDLVGTAK